ncbi:polysaccharide biosynthesis protein [Clostridium sp. D2Q-11]|uniref:Polysaccharide biosynthesis protein n=1 Tax=Anaeromonas frigoriresistens TaxID=2683708 RepID=A0A942UTF3_9FIRM|nr:nucleoside-diphosphate sugar epimerase/dehydratase [Anaeromonas frigoriresistens]MBS4538818.1 polysaccharide biosynthesis protein [Anaeromonas frigoriresistens]
MNRRMRKIILFFIDVILINLGLYLSFYLRFEGNIPSLYFNQIRESFFIITLIKLIIFTYLRLYKSLWEYASIEELSQIVMSVLISNFISLIYLVLIDAQFPRSIYILLFIFDILFIGGSRLSYRTLRKIKNISFSKQSNVKRVMIFGAGDAGARIIKELKNNNQLKYKPVVVVDDDGKKVGRRISGVPVVGERHNIQEIVDRKNIDEIIIAVPSANKNEIRKIVEECKKSQCRLKILPTISEYIKGKQSINYLRYVEIEDLLGREEVELNVEEISDYLRDKKILVTGGGGSIGSELCRQIAKFHAKEIIILDIYENNAYDLQNELKRKFKDINTKIIIASIRDRERINEVMKNLTPDIVFHVAAHKHVPLMEDNPKEAIKNNVFGTINVADAADKMQVKKFVLISTDKAVNPTNVMGASKRICEMYIQSMDRISQTEFVAVRFGNVLGSNGSVVPLFTKQISEGGPVTVTHEEVIRYFMTIQEAVQLVIQAGTMASGGEVFILNMGEPVRILKLAEDLIRLSGFEPYVDIPIIITGLRPGEKLYEELLLDEEGILTTTHEKIYIASPDFKEYKALLKEIEELRDLIINGEDKDIIDCLQKIVPNYKKPFIEK